MFIRKHLVTVYLSTLALIGRGSGAVNTWYGNNHTFFSILYSRVTTPMCAPYSIWRINAATGYPIVKCTKSYI